MKLNLAITRRECITDVDGVNRFVFTLADGLGALGNEVHVISCFERSTPSTPNLFAKKFFDVGGNLDIRALTGVLEKPIWPKIAQVWLWQGSRLLEELGVDGVIVDGIVPLRTKVVKVAVNHGIFIEDFTSLKGAKQRIYLQLARFLYQHNMDASVCVAPRLARELKEYMNMNFIVVPLPLKLSLYKAQAITHRDSSVLHVGTRAIKNAELSIRIIRKLVEEASSDVKLIVVGPRTAYIENLAKKNEDLVPEHLELRLDIPNLELRKLLTQVRALILPSEYEAFSYAVLEAFASGVPVVVSEALPSELVSNCQNGFRIRNCELDLYATRLASLLTDDDLWKTMSENALRTAKHHSHIEIAGKYQTLIEHLMAARKSGQF
jgi:glycosyltransferase involved in cell wall biosynthesis